MASSLGPSHEVYYSHPAASPLYNLQADPLVAPDSTVLNFPELVYAVPPSVDYSPPQVSGAVGNEMSMYGWSSSIPMKSYYCDDAGWGGGFNINGRPSAARIGFRTRSEVEVMDDGFRWRKYGKKAVKSSPNLRNYYQCSAEGCRVKKRVERDCDDPRYVLTTYDGVHNHATPGDGGAPLGLGASCMGRRRLTRQSPPTELNY